jgi:LacI family transcriptional regulator
MRRPKTDSLAVSGIANEPVGQRLSPRTLFELLNESNVASTTAVARATAQAERHPRSGSSRRLIGVAMNYPSWQLEEGQRIAHPYFDDILFGVRTRADAGEADVIVLTGPSSQITAEATHYVDLCRAHGADGIILASFIPEEPELASIVASEYPCVAIDLQLIGPRTSFVTSDNVGGAAVAVRHLGELGRKRIAFVGGWGTEPTAIDRLLGYESALGELGLEMRQDCVIAGGWLHERTYELVKTAMTQPEPPDAFFCASDVMAIGVMLAIEEAGLRIPEDVAVVGFDDAELAHLVTPSLTSVRQNRVGLGAAAVEAMLRMLDDPTSAPPASILPTELVLRESTIGRIEGESELKPARDWKAAGGGEQAPILERERLSLATAYERLGKTEHFEPRQVGDPLPSRRPEVWDPDRRRLVALALDSDPDQSFRHAFFDELFYGLRAQAYNRGADLLFFTNIGTTGRVPFPPFLELCRERRVDGVVVVSLPPDNPEIEALVEAEFPCVAIDVDLLSSRTAFVMSDNVEGAARVVRHLAECGHRRIAFIGGRGDERPSVDRRFGYHSELARLGLEQNEAYVAMARWLPGLAYEATARMLALPAPPDAFFCASDVMAIGAMAAVEAAGLRIPDDVAVAGFDDIDYARLVTPSLTTVRQDQDGLTTIVMDSILGLIEHPDEPPTVSVIPVELVVRDSTAAMTDSER